MNWLNIETKTLRAPEYIGSEPVHRATWLNLLGYCAEQENGGVIDGARSWKDRQWMQTCGVTLEEVNAPSYLWSWHNDSLTLWNYPVTKEEEVRAKRNAGKRGGKASGEARREAQLEAVGEAVLEAPSEAQLEAELERKGKEGKGIGKEGEEKKNGKQSKSLPLPFDDPDFIDAWSDWIQHRKEKKKPLTPTSMKLQLQTLKEMGLDRAIRAIDHSIEKGWTGIFEPEYQPKTQSRQQSSQFTSCNGLHSSF